MGILTTQDSARSFSSYVTAFGLALLISSIIYLNRLNNWAETIPCISTDANVFSNLPSCEQLDSWRRAAIVGIVIGVIDTLIVPFLICCLCCTVCGCALCVCCAGCVSSDNQDKDGSTTRNGDTEVIETTTINVEDDDQTPKATSKYDVESVVPTKLHWILNALGWILWVVAPFIATLYIVIALYKYDAIRTRNDDLFGAALALFIIGLFNLMVYFQKFVNSICGYGRDKAAKK